MGSALSTVGEKIIGGLGYAITAPFNKSCEDKCGEWDGWCFLENSCGASLFRLFKAYVLAVITIVFLYLLLWKTGLVKCLVKKSCKLSWKAFWGFFYGLGSACGCLWHKLCDTRRVYRGRRGRRDDIEMGGRLGWSDSEESVWSRKRGRSPVSVRQMRKERLRHSLRPTSSHISKVEKPAKRSRHHERRSVHHGHHHFAAGMRRTEASSALVVHGSPRHDYGRVHGARQH
ncbi:hypothetical protein QOZ80_5BG0420190 [Eleusine coracana subsp. coracana]|nr:hypothetical protein QOZ80_5BG0420190 [Eleusine coracana subsp. coracana]